MNLIGKLLEPLNNITIENIVGSYKDFQLSNPEDYPIPGVSFYADYGFLSGYTGEDGHELDFFVGNKIDGSNGFFTVWRSDDVPEEHKFYLAMNNKQLEKTLSEYEPVLVRNVPVDSMEEIVELLNEFRKDKNVV